MKLLVDEMPTCAENECPFAYFESYNSGTKCKLSKDCGYFCSFDPEKKTCKHLRKFEGTAYAPVPGCSQNNRLKFPIELDQEGGKK